MVKSRGKHIDWDVKGWTQLDNKTDATQLNPTQSTIHANLGLAVLSRTHNVKYLFFHLRALLSYHWQTAMQASIFNSSCTSSWTVCTLNNNHHGKNLSSSFLFDPIWKIQGTKKTLFSVRRGRGRGRAITRASVTGWVKAGQKGLAALALAAVLQLGPPTLSLSLPFAFNANASEFDILNEEAPRETYLIDDAGVINRVTKTDLKSLLSDLETRKGYHINCVTLRKLTSKADAFEFADQVLERWYPSVEEGNKKGLVLLVTTQKEGAVTGGPAFIQAVGDQILEGVVSENLPVLATDEKYNEALVSTAKRLVAAIDGLPDPGGPKFQEKKRESNYKTREETEEKRAQFTTVVAGLLVIAFVVPMAQYYAYVSKK